MFEKDIEELINERCSTRKYNDTIVLEETKQKLYDFAKQFDNKDYRFRIVDYTLDTGKKLSTYGLIKNAKSFIVAIGKTSLGKDNIRAVDFGYDFEHIILKATALSLKTCWMGMSYSEKNLMRVLDVSENERIVMASPIGYGKARLSVGEKITRNLIKADHRLPFEDIFYDQKFGVGLKHIQDERIRKALEMVRQSPSAGNAQPWRVIKRGERLDFYGIGKKFYDNIKDKRIDFTHNDMGIAKAHFDLVAQKYQIEGSWQRCDGCQINQGIYMFSWVNKKW